MSLLDRTPVEPNDAELIARVRGGDAAAYGDLFARHRDAALRLARSLVPGPDADDLVSEAFAKVFKVLRGGNGPDLAFRAYLLTAVRRLNVDRARMTQRATPTDDLATLDSGEPFMDTAVAGFESAAAARAFQSLPERWQLVLWHLEVEGQKPADIAPLLGMSANSVSVLAYRAREGLRQAFLQMHTAEVVDEECDWTRSKLGAYVRGAASRRDADKVQTHLEGCRPCTAVYLELTEVNSSLAALLGPLVLGSAAAAYLGSGAVAGSTGVIGALLGRVGDVVTANSQAVVIGGAAASLAVAGTVGVVVTRDDDRPLSSTAPAVVDAPSPAPVQPPAREQTAEKPTPDPQPAVAPAPPPAPAPKSEPESDLEPAPAPGPESAPAPAPAPAPEPAPSSEPAPEPVPEPRGTATVEVRSSWRHLLVHLGGPHRHTRFRVIVAGLAPDQTARLTITSTRELMPRGQLMPAGCRRTGDVTVTCASVGNGTLRFLLSTRTLDPVKFRASLS